ncbi:MAG TPA: DUF2147 domain-containing protein, partial [Nitrosopumilaceae archaeon]|jgi:uncharacterized protein (DUF2147 family)|nr:DUF2147 domain-containing protein [Nitrosopumilaceae archaeon]
MKKIFVTTVIFILTVFSMFAQKHVSGSIVGIWLSEDKNVEVEIFKAGPQYFGKQVWGQSNAELNRMDLKNLIILTNFDYDGGIYDGGSFFDYKSGKKYKSIIKIQGSKVLKIRNYTVVSLFGKTTKWTRVSP